MILGLNTCIVNNKNRDGTTDVTRTLHFGIPRPIEKEMYTKVLLGNLDLERITFPNNKMTTGIMLDTIARRQLWSIGKNYGHGTGHGVGHFLCVHEGPIGISPGRTIGFEEGMVCSNGKFNGYFMIEPGYYKSNEFGIRIENVLICKKSELFEDFLCFENITMVPYCQALIDWNMMSKDDVEYINKYHQKVNTNNNK